MFKLFNFCYEVCHCVWFVFLHFSFQGLLRLEPHCFWKSSTKWVFCFCLYMSKVCLILRFVCYSSGCAISCKAVGCFYWLVGGDCHCCCCSRMVYFFFFNVQYYYVKFICLFRRCTLKNCYCLNLISLFMLYYFILIVQS